jgi:hypothetical protein
MLRHKIEHLVAPEIITEREDSAAKPLPDYMIIEEHAIDADFGSEGGGPAVPPATDTRRVEKCTPEC